jgi:hypothetical protein
MGTTLLYQTDAYLRTFRTIVKDLNVILSFPPQGSSSIFEFAANTIFSVPAC